MDILLGLLEALDLLGNLACAPFTFASAVAGAVMAYALGGGGGLIAAGAVGGASLGAWLALGLA